MKTTNNYGLKKPDGTDLVNIEDLNANADTIDTKLKTSETHVSDTTKHITSTERSAWNAKAGTATATTSANGLMAAADKTKLDGIAAGANKYTHPSYTARATGLNKVTVDGTGHVSAVSAVTKGDITGLGIPAQDTVYTHPSSHPASMITGLAVVATSGNYNSLSNRPTVPMMASYTATISTTWSGSAAPYTQVLTVSGLLTTDKQVHISPNYSTTLATAKAQQEAWNLIAMGDVTANNQITFKCFGDKPTTAIPIKLEVTR